MNLSAPLAGRRRLLRGTAALLAGPLTAVVAQSGKAPTSGRGITVAQIFDTSAAQQDVAKDFLIGSRAAWQDINSRGGLHGRAVNHVSIEVDGTSASLRSAIASVRDNASCVVLSGTTGDPVATQVLDLIRQDNLSMAHAAPWLQNSTIEVDDRTFPIFAAHQEQIGHALRALAGVGVNDVGAVYASPQDYKLHREDIERVAAGLKLRLQSFRGEGDLTQLGQRLTAGTPAILLFLGGTPELIQLAQGLEKQQRQRYLVALADVNLQTVSQIGGARSTPIIVTQPVPVASSSLPVVRAYRDALARLFDEPPAQLSLAGFIAARYTYEVMSAVDGTLTRDSVLAAFQRRSSLDVGGYRVSFDPRRRSGAFVTQSMLTPDGRVVG